MHPDSHLQQVIQQIEATRRGELRAPVVRAFFHEPTFTATYVVHDPATKRAAIVDSVLDFDQPSGRTSTPSADAIVGHVQEAGLTVEWLLETHAHADHLSAAPYLKDKLGAALLPSALAYGLVRRMERPLLAQEFCIPQNRVVEGQLLTGAVLFGIGWGLVGLCPGPAIAGLAFGTWQAALFVAAMVAGMGLHRFYAELQDRRAFTSSRSHS